MKVWVDGHELELYTIGQTANILKRSVETMRAWERQKVIPRPMYSKPMKSGATSITGKGNVRLYHPLEVEAMRKVLKKLPNYARKEDIQREMWAALKVARLEILGKTQNDNNRTEQAGEEDAQAS